MTRHSGRAVAGALPCGLTLGVALAALEYVLGVGSAATVGALVGSTLLAVGLLVWATAELRVRVRDDDGSDDEHDEFGSVAARLALAVAVAGVGAIIGVSAVQQFALDLG